jgi:hypothetical protein
VRPNDSDSQTAFERTERIEAAHAERRARDISTIGLTVLPPALLVLVIIAVLASRLQPGPAHSGANGARAVATTSPTATFPIPSTQVPFIPPTLPTPPQPPFAFPAQWQTDSAAPGNVASVVFSPSAPQFGYLCIVNGSGPGGALAQSAAPHAAPAHPAGGLGALFVTTHGGLAWSPLTGVPFGQPTNCRLTLDSDDPRSLYVVVDTPTGAQTSAASSTLWHTPDGGQTWQEPSVPPVPGFSSLVAGLTVSGQRIVALVFGISQSTSQPPTLLDASDDGGHTWRNITPALTLDGQRISISGPLLSMGPTLIIGGVLASTGPVGASFAIPRGSSPGGPAPDTHYFASTDGGATWTPMNLPAHLLPTLTFIPSADGSTFYGAVSANQRNVSGDPVTVPYLTQDAGHTWVALPTLDGVANGYLNTYEPGSPLAVSPTGAVLIQTFHSGDNGAAPAGVFLLSGPTAAWQPLAYDPNVFGWQQVASAPGDGRLWGIRFPLNGASGGNLVYVDLP